MTRTATVNYHVHKDERQFFELDAGGVVGTLISPELVPTEVEVSDIRVDTNRLNFDEDAVAFSAAPSRITDFEHNDGWHAVYDQELSALLKTELGAKEVVVFDHTVRIDDPQATRKPARNVHSDYSEDGAHQRLIDILGEERADEWSAGHYAFINIWRPIESPINSAPLGFIRPASLDPSDWVLLDLVYPDRKGQIMGLVGNPRHEWIYQSKMTPSDVVYFNIYDNRGRPSVAHSALDMIEDDAISTIRKSIESRTVVRF